MLDWINTARKILGILLVISLPPAILWWFAVHPFVEFWRRLGTKRSFTVIGIFFLAAIAGLYMIKDTLLGRDLGTSIITASIGLPLYFIAAIIAVKRKKYLTFRILAGVPEVSGQGKLLNEGIYSVIRHPRYVEFMLGCTGWAFLTNYVGVYIMTAVTIVGILVIVPLEERELRDRFGEDYVKYCAEVPRFIPRLPK